MAESKSALFTKSVQKHAGRAKEKVRRKKIINLIKRIKKKKRNKLCVQKLSIESIKNETVKYKYKVGRSTFVFLSCCCSFLFLRERERSVHLSSQVWN